MSSLTDELAKEVTDVIEAPCVRLEGLADFSLITEKNTAVAEVEDVTKPYLHFCKTLANLQEELTKRQSDVSEGRSTLQHLTDSVGEMEEKLGQVKKENANKESAFLAMETKVKSKNNQLDEMRVQLEEYSSKVNKYLGLDISVIQSDIPNHFNISFTGLTTGGVCSCDLSIDPATNFYKIVKTQPGSLEVRDAGSHGDFVEKVQSVLNETQDLSGFVVAMRKRFKAVVAANQSA